MNSRERVIKALNLGVPDIVPVMELLIDKGVIKSITGDENYLNFVKVYGLDIAFTYEVYKTEWIDEEKKIFIDEWGIKRRIGTESIAMPIEGPIKSKKDLENYMYPDPECDFRLGELPKMVDFFNGEVAIGFRIHDAFSYPYYLMGLENFLVDLYKNQDLVEKVVKISVEFHKKLAIKALKAGADIIVFGDDYAMQKAPFMSRDLFERFILPGLRELVKTVKENNGYCLKHTDGNINEILDLIIGTGIDAIHPLEAISGMNILDVKKRYGNEVCICGSVDCSKTLTFGSVEDVINETKWYIDNIGKNGGYILASSNSIHSSVKPKIF